LIKEEEEEEEEGEEEKLAQIQKLPNL